MSSDNDSQEVQFAQVQLSKSGISDGGGRRARLDKKTEFLVGIDSAQHKIHDGDSYMVTHVKDVANSGSFDILLQTYDSTKLKHLVVMVQSEAEAELKIYEGTPDRGSDIGAELDIINKDRNSVNTASMDVTLTPTLMAGGVGGNTLIYKEHWGAGAIPGNAINYVSRGLSEFILKNNTEYTIRLTNITSSANQISVILGWYEHINLNN